MNEISGKESALNHLKDVSEKIKEYRSAINEMWSLAGGGPDLDAAVISELDRVADALTKLIDAFQVWAEGNYRTTEQLANEALAEVVKSTSAALDQIVNQVRYEADSKLQFHSIRQGDFRSALDARGEGMTNVKEARSYYEKDQEAAIPSYMQAIEKFSQAGEEAGRGGFGSLGMLLNLAGLAAFLLAVISFTPLGDIIRKWIGQLFESIFGKVS